MAKKTKAAPKFVNMQKSPTMVPGEDGRTIRVHPFDQRHEALEGATYVVEGKYFEDFCSARGPLYPFPAQAVKAAEAKAAAKAEQVSAAAAEAADVAPDAPEAEPAKSVKPPKSKSKAKGKKKPKPKS